MKKKSIAITLGDPAGIGPEITLKALSAIHPVKDLKIVMIGLESAWEKSLKRWAPGLSYRKIDGPEQIGVEDDLLFYQPEGIEETSYQMGRPDAFCGEVSYRSILDAVRFCQEKKVAAMVTTPICKESLHLAGHYFDGHTGLLAHLTQTKTYRMTFAAEKLKIVHVTAHMALKQACEILSTKMVLDSIVLGDQHMKQLGIDKPKIAVCGLNPHAGENGIFGKEDLEVIRPAVEQALSLGIDAAGPLPGDTTFLKAFKGDFDLVVAQYHDQGHIPGKLVAFDSGVNVTIGLPIIRTSVDHGTAFDIAGQGIADHGNLLCAIDYARKMIHFKD